jgi:hypothetical protein
VATTRRPFEAENGAADTVTDPAAFLDMKSGQLSRDDIDRLSRMIEEAK